MGDRNTAHPREAPSSYLQGKHRTIADYADIILLIALNHSVWAFLICLIFHYSCYFSPFFVCPWMALADPLSLSVCCCRSQHPWCSGGGPPRSPAHAFRQHAAGRGRGGTGERWRICCRRRSGRGLWRRGRQLHRTFRLQSKTHSDQTDLPYRAGEIRTGKEESLQSQG